MTLLLDTSILIDLERRWEPTLMKLRELSQLHPLPATITFRNWFEFELGIKERAVRNQEQALQFLSSFSVLNTTVKTAPILAELKHNYDRKGISLSLADLLIASLALENNVTVVSKDRDFEHIEEIKKVIL